MAHSTSTLTSSSSVLIRAVTRFFDWWSFELASLLPTYLRQWWRESDRVVLLAFDEKGRALFQREKLGKIDTLASIEAINYEHSENIAGLRRDLVERMDGKYRIYLWLDNDKVLRRIVQIPLAAEEYLRQTLTYEIDRYTPFKPDQVYFDYKLLDRDATQHKLSIELVAAKKETVDRELARAALLGVEISGVIPNDGRLPADSTLNLLPGPRPKSSGGLGLGIRLILGLVAVLMLGALLGVPIWQKRTTAIGLLAPLADAKKAAGESEKLRERLDKLVAQHNLLPEKKWQDHSLLMALAELSKLLPDDSFVHALDYDGKTVQIQGEAASAASLVETIDASPLFKEAGFKASVANIKGAASERFHIGATLDVGARHKPPADDPTAVPENHLGKEKQ